MKEYKKKICGQKIFAVKVTKENLQDKKFREEHKIGVHHGGARYTDENYDFITTNKYSYSFRGEYEWIKTVTKVVPGDWIVYEGARTIKLLSDFHFKNYYEEV